MKQLILILFVLAAGQTQASCSFIDIVRYVVADHPVVKAHLAVKLKSSDYKKLEQMDEFFQELSGHRDLLNEVDENGELTTEAKMLFEYVKSSVLFFTSELYLLQEMARPRPNQSPYFWAGNYLLHLSTTDLIKEKIINDIEMRLKSQYPEQLKNEETKRARNALLQILNIITRQSN